jgi:hypothetical protein
MTNITVPLNFDSQNTADADANVLLQTVLPLTPAQLSAWMAANATTIPQVQAVLCAVILGLQTDLT